VLFLKTFYLIFYSILFFTENENVLSFTCSKNRKKYRLNTVAAFLELKENACINRALMQSQGTLSLVLTSATLPKTRLPVSILNNSRKGTIRCQKGGAVKQNQHELAK